MRLLLDEMYPPALADALRTAGVDATTVREAGLSGGSDYDLLEVATAEGCAVLTENVADFVRLAGERLGAGRRHCGVLIALSTRFTRRPAGIADITSAALRVADDVLTDRVLFLEGPAPPR